MDTECVITLQMVCAAARMPCLKSLDENRSCRLWVREQRDSRTDREDGRRPSEQPIFASIAVRNVCSDTRQRQAVRPTIQETFAVETSARNSIHLGRKVTQK